MTDTDATLMTRFIATGDADAYAEILRQHSGMVYATCVRILRDRARAEDVCQETFLQLLRKAETVKGSVACWLHTTATWKAIDLIRQDSTRRKRESIYIDEKDDDESSTWDELSPFIDEALAALPEDERRALIEHFLEGRTQAALAEEQAVSQATMSRRIDAALKKVRATLERRGITVAMAALASLLATRAVEAVPPALAEELGKMAILAGAKAVGVQATATAAKLVKIFLTLAVIGGIVGAFFLFGKKASVRESTRSVHYVMQSRDNSPGAPPSLTKGAYERWYYYPQGADGAIFMRVQRWDPKMTAKLCSWLQNADANYYFHAGEQRLYVSNCHLWNRDLSIRTLPTDTPEMVAKLEAINGKLDGVDVFRDPKTGYIVSAVDHRFPEVMNFESTFEYDTLKENFFDATWASTIPVTDERDAIHKQGWTYFCVEGRIAGEKVIGIGQLPLVYREVKKHPAWMKLMIGTTQTLIECADSASRATLASKTIGFPKGYFLRGMARPWSGMHAIDVIRRDAVLCGVAIETHALDEEQTRVEVVLKDDRNYTHTRVTYCVDMERDVIESISFSSDSGGRVRDGELRLMYMGPNATTPMAYVAPKAHHVDSTTSRDATDRLWLMDLARGQLE